MNNRKIGELATNGVVLLLHEYDTVLFFLRQGRNVELIPPSNTVHARRPDFAMDGLEWEMKSPEQAAKMVVERAFDKALRQSQNIVIDLRRAKGREDIAIGHLQKCFMSSRRIKRLMIITREQVLLDFKK